MTIEQLYWSIAIFSTAQFGILWLTMWYILHKINKLKGCT